MDRRSFIKSGVVASVGVASTGAAAVAQTSEEEIVGCMKRMISLCQQSAPEGYTVDQVIWGKKLFDDNVMVLASKDGHVIKKEPAKSAHWRGLDSYNNMR